MTTTISATCSDCGTTVDAHEVPTAPCPGCGSLRRSVSVEFADRIDVGDGLVADSFDQAGPVAESVSFDTTQMRVRSHVDLQTGTSSLSLEPGTHWLRRTTEAEERAVGLAIAKVLEEETAVRWKVDPVPKEKRHPDVLLTPLGHTKVPKHEVEVRHLDVAAIAGLNSGQGLTRQETVHQLADMLKDAVMAKQSKYDPAWVGVGTLALQVPIPVGATYVRVLRDAASTLGDGFRELWLITDGTAHRLRP